MMAVAGRAAGANEVAADKNTDGWVSFMVIGLMT